MGFKRNRSTTETLGIGSHRKIEKPSPDDWLSLSSGLYLIKSDDQYMLVEWNVDEQYWRFAPDWVNTMTVKGLGAPGGEKVFRSEHPGSMGYGEVTHQGKHYLSILSIEKVKDVEHAEAIRRKNIIELS